MLCDQARRVTGTHRRRRTKHLPCVLPRKQALRFAQVSPPVRHHTDTVGPEKEGRPKRRFGPKQLDSVKLVNMRIRSCFLNILKNNFKTMSVTMFEILKLEHLKD